MRIYMYPYVYTCMYEHILLASGWVLRAHDTVSIHMAHVLK